MKLSNEEFEGLVSEVIDELPPQVLSYLDNVDFVIEDTPTQEQLASVKMNEKEGMRLLALYVGVPRTMRIGNPWLPDKITLFQDSLQAQGDSFEAVRRKVAEIVFHEVAHHFGIDDSRLEELSQAGKR